jgi:hypothetical protein
VARTSILKLCRLYSEAQKRLLGFTSKYCEAGLDVLKNKAIIYPGGNIARLRTQCSEVQRLSCEIEGEYCEAPKTKL